MAVMTQCPSCGEPMAKDAFFCQHCKADPKAPVLAAPSPPGRPTVTSQTSIAATILTVVSVLAGVGGLISLSEATLGVGLIAFACLLGIWARIAQAGARA